MPSFYNTSYTRPQGFISAHWETIYPALFRKVNDIPHPERERIRTPDDDFLDLDWWKKGNKRLVVLQHGLEGGSDRPYILGMARTFLRNSFDVLAWNYRGCSGELNRQVRFYHSGATGDLETVLDHAMPPYKDIVLLGFSLGGNLTLKYLGERSVDPKIKCAVAISTPLDLDKGATNLSSWKNYLYAQRFLKSLKVKVVKKAARMPDKINLKALPDTKSMRDFDEYFTAPIHGFESASDYYHKCSSRYFVDKIKVPTLILNALNDPLLTPESLDPKLADNLEMVHLELTRHGGHVGFTQSNKEQVYWSEQRALKFCNKYL